MFKKIGQKIYKRIREDGGIFDTIIVVGTVECRAPYLRLCNTKCEGVEYVTEQGKRYCSHPKGLRFEE